MSVDDPHSLTESAIDRVRMGGGQGDIANRCAA
jgi:hypothetical protein